MDNDIDNIMKDCINLSEIGPSGKFVNFIKYKSSEEGHDDLLVMAAPSFNPFKSDTLVCKKINKEKNHEVLIRMVNYLEKHMEKEIKEMILIEEIKIRKKIERKYHFNRLKKLL